MQVTELIQQIRRETERIRRQFIVTEIETACAFALTAETLHARGSNKDVADLISKAWEAYAEAASHLDESGIHSPLRRALTQKLNKIRAKLDAMQDPGSSRNVALSK
jgi:septation ring formation regulator EzrA